MLILGGVQTPFVLDVTFRGGDDIDTVAKLEFDTFGEAKAALENLILANEAFVDDYKIDFHFNDLMGGDIVKFDFVTITDPDRPDRKPHTRKQDIVKGVWAISWRKPEPPPQDVLDEVIRQELRMRIAADLA